MFFDRYPRFYGTSRTAPSSGRLNLRYEAIFAENIENPKVVEQIARETGAKLGGKLYADGLGEKEASTYAGMYRHNLTTIVEALK